MRFSAHDHLEKKFTKYNLFVFFDIVSLRILEGNYIDNTRTQDFTLSV